MQNPVEMDDVVPPILGNLHMIKLVQPLGIPWISDISAANSQPFGQHALHLRQDQHMLPFQDLPFLFQAFLQPVQQLRAVHGPESDGTLMEADAQLGQNKNDVGGSICWIFSCCCKTPGPIQ